MHPAHVHACLYNYEQIYIVFKLNYICQLQIIFPLQVGEEDPQEEMLMMCDDPSSQHFYKVNNYNELQELKERLLESLCDGKPDYFLSMPDYFFNLYGTAL